MGVSLFADAVRGAHYASVVLLFGCFAFLLAVARPAFRAAGAGADEGGRIERFLLPLAGSSLAFAFATGLLWLWVTAADISGRPLASALSGQVLLTVLRETTFGEVWQIRFGAAVLLAIVLALRRRGATSGSWFALECIALALSGAILATIALAGHANADTGSARVWHLGADLLHLLAAGGWVGALPPLVFLLSRVRLTTAPLGLRIAREAALRFSTLGIVSVATLILSGLVNAWYQVGNVPALVGTPYGHLLLVKLALLALMLVLASINRGRLTPLLSAIATAPDALRRLRRNAMLEAALGVLLLLVVGALVHATPAAHDQPVWPFPVQLDWTGIVITPRLRFIFTAALVACFLGVLIVVWAVLFGSRRLALAGIVLIAAAIIAIARPFVVEAYPTSYFHSPLRYNVISIARGQPLYAENCAVCHGANGYGDGPAAATLPIKPADLTGAHLFHHGEGTLFWWVSHGIADTPMPGFADRLGETERWDVLNFLRAQANAEQSSTMNNEVEPFQGVTAPDFAFQIGEGPQETLKGQREKAIVLLALYSMPGSPDRLRQLEIAQSALDKAGARIIALPMSPTATAPGPAAFLARSSAETVAAYALFRRDPVAGVPPMPTHMEFLIDRAGYLRARWIPNEEPGWREIGTLLREIDRLNREPPRPPAPEGHMH